MLLDRQGGISSLCVDEFLVAAIYRPLGSTTMILSNGYLPVLRYSVAADSNSVYRAPLLTAIPSINGGTTVDVRRLWLSKNQDGTEVPFTVE